MADPQASTVYSSVASASTSTNYEVFISHRGPDVKKTFAGHLYYRLRSHGLQPFLDKEELRAGEVGSLQIEQKPSELRWTGRYVQALSNHEQNGRYDRQTLEKWRKALYDISYIIGFELEAHNADEGKLLDIVVQWVFKKGRKIRLNVATYPTDPQEKVEESETTVSSPQRQNGKDKVPCIVCIVGMGGSGKLTTLAKKLLKRPSSNVGTLISQDRQIVMFKRETLVAATENFHANNKIGEGGFGPVYKGTTQDGRQIAVKKLSVYSKQGKEQFQNEVNVLPKIQHRNIVNILGYYSDESEIMLIYEYLPNESLDKILFDPYKRVQLDWKKRHNIIVGIVRGLLYLHEDSQLRIIHRDIKPSNILLDQKLNPKIADFGLAKVLSDETHNGAEVADIYEGEIHITSQDDTYSTTGIVGTVGYVAPEYVIHGNLSVKADVYSFGVLLLELVTGRKNTDLNLPIERQILLEWSCHVLHAPEHSRFFFTLLHDTVCLFDQG